MDNLLIGTILTITQHIYTLESSQGKHDSCTLQGQFNGYGYASNKICFKTHAEAEGIAYSWILKNYLLGLTIPQIYCKWQSGQPLKDCEYARKAASL